MTIAISMCLICLCCVFLSITLEKSVEEMVPLSLFAIVLILFPFYCLDLLLIGKVLVYAIMILILVLSCIYIRRQGKRITAAFMGKITPGIVIYAFTCVYFLFYLRTSLVGLWDELRLWGAVPKSLYYTNELQLGEDALIFNIMQSYPPGMPLFIYFLTSFASDFAEYHIFVGYAILFSGTFLPALAKLKWRQWYLFVPLAVLIIFIPCLFTSHGGDSSLFYNSLFIDSVLGVLIGYIFYLASKNPMKSTFDFVQFLISISFVILIKDSAISFAIIAIICALLLYYLEDNKTFKKRIVKKIPAITASFLLPYLAWKIAIRVYSITNHLSLNARSVNAGSFIELINAFYKMPVLHLSAFNNSISLSFILSLLLMLVVFRAINKRFVCLHKTASFITFCGMLLSTVLFSIGYLCIFPEGLPSYQRYYSTILYCYLTFIILHTLPTLIKYHFEKATSFKLISIKGVFSAIMSIVIIFVAARYFENWQAKKYDGNIYSVAQTHANSIAQSIPSNSEKVEKVYLLISCDPHSNALLHHRIYFDLIGSNINVGNFYNDTSIVGGLYTPEGYEDSDIDDISFMWTNQLIEQNYDYIYVISADTLAEKVFNCLSAKKPETGNLYKVVNRNEGLRLDLVN